MKSKLVPWLTSVREKSRIRLLTRAVRSRRTATVRERISARVFTRTLTGVVALVLLAGCSRPKPTTAQIDPALSTIIPPDTTLIVATNLDELKKTPLYRKYLETRSFPQMDQIGRFTGIDPRKDLWQLLLLSDGKHSAILARGNFQSEMETRLQRDGATVIPYKAYHLIGSEEASVVFLNTSMAAVGNVPSLKNLLEARGKTNGPPPSIGALMTQIPADVQIWAAYIGGLGGAALPLQLQGNWANLYRMLASVSSASVHFDLRNGVKATARANTPKESESKQLNDALRALVGLGRLSAPENQPDLLKALDGVHVAQEGTSVTLKVEESAELLEKLLNFAGIH